MTLEEWAAAYLMVFGPEKLTTGTTDEEEDFLKQMWDEHPHIAEKRGNYGQTCYNIARVLGYTQLVDSMRRRGMAWPKE